MGLIQGVPVSSGQILRLSGRVRSRDYLNGGYLGARIFFLAPNRQEHALVWLKGDVNWTEKQLVFTNRLAGTGSFVVHMGYTKEPATGLFKDVRLENLSFEELSRTSRD